MKKTISICATAALATLGGSAQAQEVTGRVISSTPVVQQVQVPRQVCNNQPVAVQQPRSGSGAVIGAIAGAALGNTIGHGSGRAVATGIGLVGGAAVGDRIEGGNTTVQNMQQCVTQTFYENRTVAYNVTYEYNGRQYTVQTASDPGATIRLGVSPLNQTSGAGYASGESAPAGTQSVPAVVASSSGVYPAYAPGYSAPAYYAPAYYAPAYYAPAYYAPSYYSGYAPYYAPIGISLGFGFSGGWGGGHRHHHHGGYRR